MKSLTLAATAFSFAILAGCATMNGSPVEENLPSKTPTMAWDQTELNDAHTVWIPGRYTNSGHNVLYFNHKRYTAPGGFNEIAGFLPMGKDYLVAVFQETVTPESTDRNKEPFLVFYRVDAEGKTLGQIGAIPSASSVFVANDGIYASVATGSGLHSFTGYSTQGKEVTGPQDVIDASPAKDGGWYTVTKGRVKKGKRSTHNTRIFSKLDKQGQLRKIGENLWSKDHSFDFVHTTAIFVDRPPLVDTARTNVWLRLGRLSGPFQQTRQDDRLELTGYIMPDTEPFKVAEFGTAGSVSIDAAYSFSYRIFVFNKHGRPMFGTQLVDGTTPFGRSLYWGTRVAGDEKGSQDEQFFKLLGGGMNTLRSFLGQNMGTMTGTDDNDTFNILAPHHAYAVLANQDAINRFGDGSFNLDSRMALPQEKIETFLSNYSTNL